MSVETHEPPATLTSPPPPPAGTPPPAPSLSDPPEPKKHNTFVEEAQHEIPVTVDPLLVQILSWPRKHTSFQEIQFCKFLREHIRAMGVDCKVMADGCLMATVPRPPVSTMNGPVEVLTPAKPSTTLFSCHVDTIEGYDEATPRGKYVQGTKNEDGSWTQGYWEPDPVPAAPKELRKKLTYDPHFGIIALDKESIGGSLGADDGAGLWLMLKMIEAKVPGSYIFHRGEEVGGLGSKAMVAKYPEVLKEFEAAIAFDRHQTYEVITHQGGSECASDKFGQALCTRLNSKGMKYETSRRGVFTDTKNYRGLIAECVNVAVGYESQHGRNETLDYSHLNALLDACCAIDWDSLPIDRDPAKPEYTGYSGGNYRNWMNHDLLGDADNDAWDERMGKGTGSRYKTPQQQQQAGKKKKRNRGPAPSTPQLTVSEELGNFSLEEIELWTEHAPQDAAKAIGQLLVEVSQLRSTIATSMKLLGWKD